MLLNKYKSPLPIIATTSCKLSRFSVETKSKPSFMSTRDDKTNYRFHGHTIRAAFPLSEGYGDMSDIESTDGIGITKYFRGQNILITGGTGMLGKALVEKLLRSTDVGKIYMLVRAKDEVAALDRLTKEVENLKLFKSLQQKYGKDYEKIMRKRLIPIVGNIMEPNMGLDSKLAHEISEEVNVIIQSAAITTFDERYDVLLNANVTGPLHMMKFAKTCSKLELFVHISTAYVNGLKEGIIMEEPLTMEERFSKDLPKFDVSEEIEMALRSFIDSPYYNMTNHMKTIGMQSARKYGYQTTYALTKALAEMFINEMRRDIPVLVIRPSAIESCYNDPIPGWIEGHRVIDPLITSFGKGQLPAFLGNPSTIVDPIPLDMVVSATIAAIAKHGNMHVPELNVYQIASGTINPLPWCDLFEYIYEYFSTEELLIEMADKPARIKFLDNFGDFSKYTREEMSTRFGANEYIGVDEERSQKVKRQCRIHSIYAEQMCKTYEFAGFFKARFHTGNTDKLLSEMSAVEKDNFEFDIRKIDWKKYFQQIHIPGLIKYVIGNKMASASANGP